MQQQGPLINRWHRQLAGKKTSCTKGASLCFPVWVSALHCRISEPMGTLPWMCAMVKFGPNGHSLGISKASKQESKHYKALPHVNIYHTAQGKRMLWRTWRWHNYPVSANKTAFISETCYLPRFNSLNTWGTWKADRYGFGWCALVHLKCIHLTRWDKIILNTYVLNAMYQAVLLFFWSAKPNKGDIKCIEQSMANENTEIRQNLPLLPPSNTRSA